MSECCCVIGAAALGRRACTQTSRCAPWTVLQVQRGEPPMVDSPARRCFQRRAHPGCPQPAPQRPQPACARACMHACVHTWTLLPSHSMVITLLSASALCAWERTHLVCSKCGLCGLHSSRVVVQCHQLRWNPKLLADQRQGAYHVSTAAAELHDPAHACNTAARVRLKFPWKPRQAHSRCQ